MKHTPESSTHWACEKALKILGGETPCCECTGHDCSENSYPLTRELWIDKIAADASEWLCIKREKAIKQLLKSRNLPSDPEQLREHGYEIVIIRKQNVPCEIIKLCTVEAAIQISLEIRS